MAIQFNGFRATKPVVCLADAGKSIYEVFFLVYAAGVKKRVRMRDTINLKELSAASRRLRAKCLADEIWSALHGGWDPLTSKYPTFAKEEKLLRRYTFGSALDHALSEKRQHLSKYSYYDYVGCVRFIKKAAQEDGCLDSPVEKIERKHIRLLISTAKDQNGWSSNARNKYLTILKSLLSVIVDEEIIPTNPAHGIKNEPTGKRMGFKRLTDAEKKAIEEHLSVVFPEFFEYLLFIYDLGVRRKETLMIQVKDINLLNRQITIREEVSKTNCERIIPITENILPILMRREVWTLNKEYYLFSNNRFHPGPCPYHPNVPTEWWAKLVQKGLNIDCKMYALKHTGANDKIKAGIPLLALRQLYGHKSELMTQTYADEVINSYNQLIIAHAPKFSAKVVPMRKAE